MKIISRVFVSFHSIDVAHWLCSSVVVWKKKKQQPRRHHILRITTCNYLFVYLIEREKCSYMVGEIIARFSFFFRELTGEQRLPSEDFDKLILTRANCLSWENPLLKAVVRINSRKFCSMKNPLKNVVVFFLLFRFWSLFNEQRKEDRYIQQFTGTREIKK